MPIYEFLCNSCQQLSEVMQDFDAPAPAKCEACGQGPMVKQMSRTSFQLKGSGWYTTDYKRSSSTKPAEPAPAAPSAETPTPSST